MATRDRRPLLIAALYVLLYVGGLGAWPAVRAQLCPSILIASSSEKANLMTTLAAEFSASNRNTWAGCGNVVTVEQVASGQAERELEQGWPDTATRPDVWAPAATTWVDLLAQRVSGTRFASEIPAERSSDSIAKSPLVIAMPDVMARTLGWPQKQPTWSEVLQLAADPKGWADKGHPELGPFRLGKTDPTTSTSGIHTLIAEYYAATADAGGMTPASVAQPDTRAFLARIEANVSHYAPTAGDFLSDLSAVGGAPSYISAIPVEEQEVFKYNAGHYQSQNLAPLPLDAIYPADGTLYADHPYLVLDAPWMDSGKRQIANDFRDWLLRSEQQARFAAAGFRDAGGHVVPGSDLGRAKGIVASLPGHTLAVPPGPVLDAIVRSWATFRKPARILIVLAAGTAAERQAVEDAVMNLGDADAVGVMVAPTKQPVSVTALKNGRADVESAIASAPLARGPTALYVTIEAAYGELSSSADPSRINAVVVIASVVDDGTPPSLIDLEVELQGTKAAVPVRIYTVALGKANRSALTAIERAAGGYVSSSPDPSSAIRTCLANF
ncbi:MAG TPA: substrate-binding and VWA domain-containing protein [Candidatus Dormibacteraeota bacterium]|nr:substrate-binding and VWA domain-containing protein [Candidatus Dormibacteraeota bacterium]